MLDLLFFDFKTGYLLWFVCQWIQLTVNILWTSCNCGSFNLKNLFIRKKKHWTARIAIQPYSSEIHGWFSWFLFVSANINQNWKFHQQHFGFYYYFSYLESNGLWEEEDEEEEESTNPSWTNEELIPHSR